MSKNTGTPCTYNIWLSAAAAAVSYAYLRTVATAAAAAAAEPITLCFLHITEYLFSQLPKPVLPLKKILCYHFLQTRTNVHQASFAPGFGNILLACVCRC